MSFTPKLKKTDVPEFNNKYYINRYYGGCSPATTIKNPPTYLILPKGSVLPNCVGYAISRFMEIMENDNPDTFAHLSVNAEYMRGTAKTNGTFQTGDTPQVGSIICWEYLSRAGGHVAVVEDIDSSGNITISHSGYYDGKGGGFLFDVNILSKSTNYNLSEIWGSKWDSRTQGFIYNPIVGSYTSLNMRYKIQSNINSAIAYTPKAFRRLNNLSENTVLYCPFVKYCLSKISDGEESKLIKYSECCSALIQGSIDNKLGNWYSYNDAIHIDTGDIVGIGKRTSQRGNITYVVEIGIVIDVNDDIVTYAYGDSKQIGTSTIKVSNMQYFGFYRPNYSNTEAYKQLAIDAGFNPYEDSTPQLLYTTYTTNKDATLLHIAGIDPVTTKPCINMGGDIKLSVINYTSLLGSLISSFYYQTQNKQEEFLSTMQQYTVSALNTNSVYLFQDPVTFNGESGGALQNCGSIIFNYLVNHKFPISSAIGILGYIWGESRFQTYAYNKLDGGSGLCQWTNTTGSPRATKMYQYVGSDWKNNLTKQLDYLLAELQGMFIPLYDFLLSRSNTYDDMRAAAIRFSTNFGGGISFYVDLESALARYETHYPGAEYAHITSAIWMWNNNLKPITKPVKSTLKSTIGETV